MLKYKKGDKIFVTSFKHPVTIVEVCPSKNDYVTEIGDNTGGWSGFACSRGLNLDRQTKYWYIKEYEITGYVSKLQTRIKDERVYDRSKGCY